MSTDTTVLTISGVGVTPYSARGLVQSLEPIGAAVQMRRTVNGELRDISMAQFRKYRSTISGSDQQPPAVGGLWPGQLVTVGCIAELAYQTATGSPERPAVPGSSRVEGDFTFFRPSLQMRVTAFSMSADEWRAGVQWSLSLEEA